VSGPTAALLAATVSGTVSVLVLLLQQYLHRTGERQQETARRLAEFSAASWAFTLELGRLARAPMDQKSKLGDELERDGDRARTALALIQLLDEEAVYQAATEVYAHLFQLHQAARSAVWTREDWRETRRPLSRSVVAFQSASRRALGSPAIDLNVRGAEPPATDLGSLNQSDDAHFEHRLPIGAGREPPAPSQEP
jgi:hypothetical protein